jgi:hypothetical protein
LFRYAHNDTSVLPETVLCRYAPNDTAVLPETVSTERIKRDTKGKDKLR